MHSFAAIRELPCGHVECSVGPRRSGVPLAVLDLGTLTKESRSFTIAVRYCRALERFRGLSKVRIP